MAAARTTKRVHLLMPAGMNPEDVMKHNDGRRTSALVSRWPCNVALDALHINLKVDHV